MKVIKNLFRKKQRLLRISEDHWRGKAVCIDGKLLGYALDMSIKYGSDGVHDINLHCTDNHKKYQKRFFNDKR